MKQRLSLAQRLALYVHAVQHPRAEADLLARIFRRHRRADAERLREDFSGSAALAAAWVASDESRRALAIERHAPTARFAARYVDDLLADRAQDCFVIHDDVMNVTSPKVDIIAALNFSSFIFHTRSKMLAYLKHARKSLRTGGIVVLDLYGGPGAMRVSTQRRQLDPTPEFSRIEYQWEQRSVDLATGKVDCRIHFDLIDTSGHAITARDAFIYEWRLWSPVEMLELLQEAGFAHTQFWCDHFDEKSQRSDGVYQPVQSLPSREDFIAYAVGLQ